MALYDKESFRLRVNAAGYLPIAKQWYLDGILESGEICPPCAAKITIEGSVFKISILSVALVSAKKPEKNRFTLSIEDPKLPPEKLNNTLIVGLVE